MARSSSTRRCRKRQKGGTLSKMIRFALNSRSLSLVRISPQVRQDNAVIRHLLWKLFHIKQGIQSSTEAIQEKNDALKDIRKEHDKYEDLQKAARKDVAKAQKDVTKQDKVVKKREKELEDSVRFSLFLT